MIKMFANQLKFRLKDRDNVLNNNNDNNNIELYLAPSSKVLPKKPLKRKLQHEYKNFH